MARPPATYGKGRLRPVVPRAVAAHLQQSGGGSSVDASQSTLTAASFTFTGDGVTTDTLTLTTKDAQGIAVSGVAWTATVEKVQIDAALSVVTASPSEIVNDGSDTAYVTITAVDEDGFAAPGIAAAQVVLAVNGASNTLTQPAAATNQSGQAFASFVTTQAATKVASATICGQAITDTASVVATGTPSLWTPMVTADWGTATGVTSNAIGDGGTFDQLTTDFEDSAEVIAAPGGEGWASTNVLKVYSASGVRSGYIETRHNGLGTIAEGEVRNFRWGYSVKHPTAAEGATDNSHHGIQDGSPSGSGTDQNWNLTDGTDYVGEWQPNILTGGNSTGSRYYLVSAATPTRLTKGVKYTFDIQMERGSGANTNSFQMRAWVYDSDGALLYGPSDWKSGLYSGETLATTRWIPFNNLSGTDAIAFGLNGTSGTWPIYHSDQGEVAVVSSDDNPSLTLGTSIEPFGSCTGE